jgi:hypothetical protein
MARKMREESVDLGYENAGDGFLHPHKKHAGGELTRAWFMASRWSAPLYERPGSHGPRLLGSALRGASCCQVIAHHGLDRRGVACRRQGPGGLVAVFHDEAAEETHTDR